MPDQGLGALRANEVGNSASPVREPEARTGADLRSEQGARPDANDSGMRTGIPARYGTNDRAVPDRPVLSPDASDLALPYGAHVALAIDRDNDVALGGSGDRSPACSRVLLDYR